MTEIAYRTDSATVAEVSRHLRACDADFDPPLSDRVDLDAYAAKLCARATRLEAFADGRLIGLVAAYLDPPRGFVTNVSVERRFRGAGVGDRLLTAAIDAAREAGLPEIALEARGANAATFYRRYGFSGAGEGGLMSLTMKGE